MIRSSHVNSTTVLGVYSIACSQALSRQQLRAPALCKLGHKSLIAGQKNGAVRIALLRNAGVMPVLYREKIQMKNKLLRCLPVTALLTMSVGLAAPASAQEGLTDLLPVELNESIPGSAKQTLGRFGASTEPVAESPNGIYIVQMIDDPVVAYEGGIKGLKATKPSKGKKIDPNSQRVVDYVDHLNAKHADALDKAGGGQKVYNYQYSFNGFAAKLSHDQAKQLQSVEGVVAVHADERLFLDTATTPTFIGLDSPGGLWDTRGVTWRGCHYRHR